MKHVIIGMAGHVDHGKTELVKALTGVDTDRLAEEKKRGITIDLGFARLDFPDGSCASIVDVPGHERFIKNMLAGAGGVDLAMLVVAADEGFMPQTVEHLDILQLLGVKDGLIVLTKTDLVDEDWLNMLEEDVKSRVKGTFLEDKPILRTSVRTGEGVEALREALHVLTLHAEEKSARTPFRLPIDRVFSVDGFGTIVTGTLIDGHIAVGERGADGMTLADLAACFDEPEEKLVEMLAVLCARGKLVEIAPSRYLTSSTLDRLWTDCETMLTKYHREHPLHAGMRLAEARQRLLRGKARENADAILACFAREGKLTLTAEHCALADFSVHLTKRQSAIREELLRTCRAAGILGKKQDALCALFDKKDRVECAHVLESLLSTGELVLLAPELCVEKSVLDAVDARVKAWFETHDTLTLGEFRDALGTSRDHALLVLEYYDRRGILRREGDVRRPGAQFGEIEK